MKQRRHHSPRSGLGSRARPARLGSPGKRTLTGQIQRRARSNPSNLLKGQEKPEPGIAANVEGAPALSLEHGLAAGRQAQARVETIRAALLPGYRNAVDAVDPMATMELAAQITAALRSVRAARHEIDLVVCDGDPGRWMMSTATSPGDDSPEAVQSRWAELQALRSLLVAEQAVLLAQLARELSPATFRGEPVDASVAEPPMPRGDDAVTDLAIEAGRMVELLAMVGNVRAIAGTTGAECPALDERQKQEIAAVVRPWRSRPVDFLFLVHVLRLEGIWEQVEHVRTSGEVTLDATRGRAMYQAQKTGAFTDVGRFDAVEVSSRLRAAPEKEASEILAMLRDAAPNARGPLVRQLHELGVLGALCHHLPWRRVQLLHDAVEDRDPRAASLLRPYLQGQGGGESLHRAYRNQVDRNLKEDDPLDAFGWFFLDMTHNAFTGGFHQRYSQAYDAHQEGWINEDEFHSASQKALGRAALVTLVGGVAGGAAGAWAQGVAGGLRAGQSAAAIIGGGVGGFAGGVSAYFAGDVYDQTMHGKEGFEPLGSYLQAGAIGGVMGTGAAGVGVAAGRYLPASSQRLSDWYAQRHPTLVHVLEKLQNAGAGHVVTIRVKAAELKEMLTSGLGGASSPEALALAGGGDIRGLPGETEIELTLLPEENLGRPLQMSSRDQGRAHSGKPPIRIKKTEVAPRRNQSQDATRKPVNLPSWKRVQIDIDHIASGHMRGGARASPSKGLFPDHMNRVQIERAVRQAYRFSKKLRTQGSRVLLQGETDGLTLEIWLNRKTETVETAYPVLP